jgi:hypothetical protein
MGRPLLNHLLKEEKKITISFSVEQAYTNVARCSEIANQPIIAALNLNYLSSADIRQHRVHVACSLPDRPGRRRGERAPCWETDGRPSGQGHSRCIPLCWI